MHRMILLNADWRFMHYIDGLSPVLHLSNLATLLHHRLHALIGTSIPASLLGALVM